MPELPLADVIYLHASDNICVAANNLAAKTELSAAGKTFSLREPIKIGHKIAVAAIGKDEPVRKYGQIIGFMTEPVEPMTLPYRTQ